MTVRRGAQVAMLAAAGLVLLAVPHLARWRLLEVRGFGPDEFEHLHFAWSIAQGLVPYRDYFDHHTPAFHYLLAPIFRTRHVERSVTDAYEAIFLARRITWLFAGASLALTFAVGRAWRDPRTGLVAAVLFGNTAIFLRKALEVRPDVPATAFCLGAVWFGLEAMRPGITSRRRTVLFAGSGLLLGTAVMFTQKVLFIGPGWMVALVLYLLAARRSPDLRPRLGAVSLHAAAAALPLAVTLLYFSVQGALGPFLRFNFLINASWPGLGPRAFLAELVRRDPVLVGLAMIGAITEAARLRRGDASGSSLLLLSTASLVGGLLVLPAVTFHYFLLFLPLAAALAAAAMVGLFDRLGRPSAGPAASTAARDGLLVLALAGLSLPAVVRLREAFTHTNQGTLDGIRFVLRNTAPWEPVLDGFSGLGVFRPLGSFYGFLHRDNWAIQSEDEKALFVRSLLSGEVSPKLVFWDHYLQEPLPAELKTFIEQHYGPGGPDPIWVRLDDGGAGWWTDDGRRYLGWAPGHEREPHVFVGEGWKQPEDEGGTSLRASRGRFSELFVPIRDARAFRALVRARADAALGAALRLSVNDVRQAEICLKPGWAEYAFDIPAGVLRSGLNRFVLSYPAGRCGKGNDDLERVELKVEFLELQPPFGPS